MSGFRGRQHQIQVWWIVSPFKATGVGSYLHSHSVACVEMDALDGDPGASRHRPIGRLDAGEVRRLRRDTWGENGLTRRRVACDNRQWNGLLII